MPKSSTLLEIAAKLSHPDIGVRISALREVAGCGAGALGVLAGILRDPETSPIAKAWAIMGLGYVGETGRSEAISELLAAADNESAAVRWAALHQLGHLRAAEAVPIIVKYLADHAEVPGAWFEDDCRVSHAAAEALQRIEAVDAAVAPDDGSIQGAIETWRARSKTFGGSCP